MNIILHIIFAVVLWKGGAVAMKLSNYNYSNYRILKYRITYLMY